MLHDALSNLKAHNLIEEESPGYWIPTKIGQATVAGGFSPTDGVFLHKELSKALQNFNLETDVQITYQLTPIHGTSTPHDLRSMRWEILRDALDGFDDASLRAATFITVNPGLVNKMCVSLVFLFYPGILLSLYFLY